MEHLTTMQEVFESVRKEEVNSYLKAGWTLICVGAGTWDDTKESYIRYSLGWDKALPSKHPQPKF